jgi:antitoxin component YwqK of YwqJK toxin-antitoxin module
MVLATYKKHTLLSFLFLFALNSFAQKPDQNAVLRHSIKQGGLAYYFTVLEMDKKPKTKHRKDKFYYWYKAQKIMQTQGGSSGILLHGLFESFYPNKQLHERGKFSKGLKSGEWFLWRNDGTLLRTEKWRSGLPKGIQIDYSTTGLDSIKTIIRGNSKKIISISSLVIIKGEKSKIYSFNEKGDIEKIIRRKNNLLHGKQVYYDSGKILNTEKYRKGELKESKKHQFSFDFIKRKKQKTDSTKVVLTDKKDPKPKLKIWPFRKNKSSDKVEKIKDSKESDKSSKERKKTLFNKKRK